MEMMIHRIIEEAKKNKRLGETAEEEKKRMVNEIFQRLSELDLPEGSEKDGRTINEPKEEAKPV